MRIRGRKEDAMLGFHLGCSPGTTRQDSPSMKEWMKERQRNRVCDEREREERIRFDYKKK